MSEREMKYPTPPQGGDATIPVPSNSLARMQLEAANTLLERYANPAPSIEVTYVDGDGVKYRGILYLVKEENDEL